MELIVRSKIFPVFTLTMFLLASQLVHAQSMEELASIIAQESDERRKTQELEENVIAQKDRAEKLRRQNEIKILTHKNNIETLKASQEKYQREIDSLQIEFVTLDGRDQDFQKEWTLFEAEYAKNLSSYEKLKKEYLEKQQKLNESIALFEKQKLDAENNNYLKGMELQRLKSEYAALETRAQQADTVRAVAEADELVTKTSLMQIKIAIADKIRQGDEAETLAQLTRRKLDKANGELTLAQNELAKYDKIQNETSRKVYQDVAKYEKEIIAANSKRMLAESEKIRLQTEIEKLKDYSSRIKSNYDKAVTEQSDASSMVLKTRLAVHAARTELNSQAQAVDQQDARQNKAEAKNRSIAATAQVAEMFSGTKQWIGSTDCKMYSEPSSSAKIKGSIARNSRVLARESVPGWVEVIDGSSIALFIESRCGRYSSEEGF